MNHSPIFRKRRTPAQLIRRHLLEGWGGLFIFILLGAILEVLLAFRVSLYVRADQEALRLMWRLAHAHGTLLALLHLGFAYTLSFISPKAIPQPAGLASGCLTGASILIPSGFFLGGLSAQAGDPGAAVLLVPAGAVLLLVAVGTIFQLVSRAAGAELTDNELK